MTDLPTRPSPLRSTRAAPRRAAALPPALAAAPTLLLLALLGCGGAAPPEPPAKPSAAAEAARAAPPEPPATWLELEGARMLMTTTRAAAGAAEATLPLLVVLHWSTSTPEELLREMRYVDIDVPARILAIEGFERVDGAFSWWRRARPAPAPADPDHDPELIAMLEGRAARLATLLGAVQRHFESATPPVVSGISQGGDLSVLLAVRHPEAIAAALPIGARLPEQLWPATPVAAEPGAAARPILDAFQGVDDPMAPFPALERALRALAARGLSVQLHRFPGVKHEVTDAVRASVQACAALRLLGSRQPCPPAAR